MIQPYEIIIGLEVHVQLATAPSCSAAAARSSVRRRIRRPVPSASVLPGTLPVMNRQAFQLALQTAVALNCEIPRFTKWDRKQYYYPDLPKGYQISQYDLPMSADGWLEISDPKGAVRNQASGHHPGSPGRRCRQEHARRSGPAKPIAASI